LLAILAGGNVFTKVRGQSWWIKGATVSIRVTANLSEPAVEALLELARKRDTDATGIIHYAISLARQLDQEVSQGGKLFIQKSNGSFWRQDL